MRSSFSTGFGLSTADSKFYKNRSRESNWFNSTSYSKIRSIETLKNRKDTFDQKVLATLNNFNQNDHITINTVHEENSKSFFYFVN